MDKVNLDALADRLLKAMRDYVALAKGELTTRLDALGKRLDAFPRPRDGKDADMAAIGELVTRLVEERCSAGLAALAAPKDGADGAPGAPGKDAVLPDIAAMINAAWAEHLVQVTDRLTLMVRDAFAAVPKARDGVDGKDAVLPDINAMLEAAVNALPRPRDGKDGAPGKDAVLPDVNALVAEAVAAIPKPRDGKDAVLPDIPALVAEAFKQYPRPRDGKDADMNVIGDLVTRLVNSGIATALEQLQLPVPKDGAAGQDGRDAAELNILPSIDETKPYRRGTWASHRGGLIRAARETSPVKGGDLLAAGWSVMVEGVGALVVEQGDDPRVLNVFSQLTSGVLVKNAIRVPVLMYKEVWREGSYMQGDVVTWGGSAWHCQKDNTIDKPGTSEGWKLMVKEGARGKDGGDTPAKGHHVVRTKDSK